MAGRAARVERDTSNDKRETKNEKRAAKPESRASKPEASATDLDRVIHERMRLAIVSALAVNDSLTFNDLKGLLETTDGNLSVHARKLEDAKYIAVDKSFFGPDAEDPVPADRGRAQGVREIHFPHGVAHQGRPLGFFRTNRAALARV